MQDALLFGKEYIEHKDFGGQLNMGVKNHLLEEKATGNLYSLFTENNTPVGTPVRMSETVERFLKNKIYPTL